MNILRFGLENYRSYRDYTEVSFVSTALNDQPNFRIKDKRLKYGILPALAVYGANASGKSNLLNGLLEMRQHVLNSFKLAPDAKILWTPWKPKTVNEPTTFDIDFVEDGVRYHYGFSHNDQQFLDEWLHRWPKNHRQVMFERSEEGFYFGPSLKGQNQVIKKSTRPNALFLSTAAQHNHKMLGPLFQAIAKGIQPDSPIELHGFPVFFPQAPILAEENRDRVCEILKAFDLGCVAVRIEPVKISTIPTELENIIVPEILEELKLAAANQESLFRVVIQRQGPDGTLWEMAPHLESRGTNILLRRLNDLLSTGQGVLVIDELETSLHPEICAALVGMFTSKDSNKRQAQILFSTHNRSLLNELRRDEILMVTMRADGVSILNAASDYPDIRARARLSEVYAEGRMGGIPVLGDLGQILGD